MINGDCFKQFILEYFYEPLMAGLGWLDGEDVGVDEEKTCLGI